MKCDESYFHLAIVISISRWWLQFTDTCFRICDYLGLIVLLKLDGIFSVELNCALFKDQLAEDGRQKIRETTFRAKNSA